MRDTGEGTETYTCIFFGIEVFSPTYAYYDISKEGPSVIWTQARL